MPNLVGAMARKPELARAIRDGFLAGRRAALSEVLRRGVERGDLRPDLDVELALDVLGGPLFYRLLITGGPIDEQLAVGVADLIMRGLLGRVVLLGCRDRANGLEFLVLGQELLVLRRQVGQREFGPADGLLLTALSRAA